MQLLYAAEASLGVQVADQITELKLGNGTSILIFANIVSALPTSVGGAVQQAGLPPTSCIPVVCHGSTPWLMTVVLALLFTPVTPSARESILALSNPVWTPRSAQWLRTSRGLVDLELMRKPRSGCPYSEDCEEYSCIDLRKFIKSQLLPHVNICARYTGS